MCIRDRGNPLGEGRRHAGLGLPVEFNGPGGAVHIDAVPVQMCIRDSNHTMQRLIEGAGFRRCGVIYVEDGSPRIAYQTPCP